MRCYDFSKMPRDITDKKLLPKHIYAVYSYLSKFKVRSTCKARRIEGVHTCSEFHFLTLVLDRQFPVPGLGDPMAKRGPQVAYKMPMAISVLSFG